MERLIEDPYFAAAKTAAEQGIELAYEADRAFDIMKGLENAMKAFSDSHAIEFKIHGAIESEEERTLVMPYRQPYRLLENAYFAQHALYYDYSEAASGLIGENKIGSKYLEPTSTAK